MEVMTIVVYVGLPLISGSHTASQRTYVSFFNINGASGQENWLMILMISSVLLKA